MFNYLPTIVAVLFGLLWGVSWHDYRRLEPFFQMSKKDGATAENSMLLDYPYQFPIFLPWVAFKKRYVVGICRHGVKTGGTSTYCADMP